MIRAVIFDWGGVIMRTVDTRPRLKWDVRLGLAPGSVNRLVFESREWRCAQLGQISEDEAWTQLGTQLKLSLELLGELRRDFWAGDRLDHDLVTLIRHLRSHFKTALLSNFPASLRDLLTQLSVTDAFDAITISGEEGIVKPDARIYQLAAQRSGVPTNECLLVDDFVENVKGACAAGMQALHFAPVDSAMAELRRMTAS
jgi:epoxide hydrolase-like predicted phosphatase